jgi:hypothetical protein
MANVCCPNSAPSVAGNRLSTWKCEQHGSAPLAWVRRHDGTESHLAHWLWGPMGFNTIDHAICGAAQGTVVLCDSYPAAIVPCEGCQARQKAGTHA